MGLELGAMVTPGAVNTDFQKELRIKVGCLIRKRSSWNAEGVGDKNWRNQKDVNKDFKMECNLQYILC